MKKIFTLIAACVLGVMSAMAEDTYEGVYSKALADWTNDDVAVWGGNSNLTVDATHGLGFDCNLYGGVSATATKSFEIADKAKVKYVVDWYYGSSLSNAGNYAYLQFGDKIRLGWFGGGYRMNLSIDGGASYSVTSGIQSGSNTTYTTKVTIILDGATGKVESFLFGSTNITNLVKDVTSTVFNTITYGFTRGGRGGNWNVPCRLASVNVSQCKQTVTTADYAVNYVFENNTIKTVTGTNTVGSTVEAESPIVIENQKYYAVDGATTSMTIDADATKNVLNVELRKANEYSWSVTSNLNTTIVAGTGIEDETVNYAYPKYILDGTKLYSTGRQSNNPWWGKSLLLDADNKSEVITYSNPIENVVYYSEAEAIEGAIFTSANNADIRCSGKAGGYANAPLTVATLPAGKYILYTSIWGNAGTTINFFAGDQNILAAECKGYIVDCNSVEFTSYGNTVISFSGANNSHPVDYIYIVKTGDVTSVPVAVNASGTASYVTPCALDFTGSKLTAYIATGVSETTITLAEVTTVAAGQAIVVKGESCDVNVIASAETTGNIFTSGAHKVEAGENIFALSTAGDFRKVDEGVEIPAGKAYIIYNGTAAKTLALNFGGEATGISNATTAKQNTAAFNLMGQKVNANAKGIVIINGKKFNNK